MNMTTKIGWERHISHELAELMNAKYTGLIKDGASKDEALGVLKRSINIAVQSVGPVGYLSLIHI